MLNANAVHDTKNERQGTQAQKQEKTTVTERCRLKPRLRTGSEGKKPGVAGFTEPVSV